MANPNIKTGGYTNDKNNIRTQKITTVNTGHNTKHHKSGRFRDNLSGWIGEPNTNSTTDTGIEAANVAVFPATKKVVGNTVNKVVDTVVDKATSSASPQRYRVIPSSMNTIRQNDPTGRKKIGKAIQTGKIILCRKDEVPKKYTNHLTSGIKTRRHYVPTGRIRVGNAIKTGKKVAYRKPNKVKTSTWRKPEPPKSSNAHIDSNKVSDTGAESIQGIRTSRDKVRHAAHIGSNIAMATGAAASIMTGRYVNEYAKMSLKGYAFQGNTSYKRFYTDGAKIDKQSTTNTGTDAIQGTRIAIRTGRNAVVGVKNTIGGAKKTYKVGRQIYTKTKTVVRNTSKSVKSIKNAKSSVERAKIVAKAIKNTVKAIIRTVKVLANPLVLKGLAIIAAVLLLLVIMSGAVQAIFSVINSNFGWLYDPADPVQTSYDAMDKNKVKVVGFIDDVNDDYMYTRDVHPGYEYGFDDVGSEYCVKSEIYRDILAILIVQKQKLAGITDTDPEGVFDLIDIRFKNSEIKSILKKFYTMTKRSDSIQCGGCYCPGHMVSSSVPGVGYTWSYCSVPCRCRGHSAVYVKIVNHSSESVMASLGFDDEEIDRVATISQVLADIEAGVY